MDAESQRQMDGLGLRFYNMRLGGVQAAPGQFLRESSENKYASFRDAMPADLTDKVALDVGCKAGFYALERTCRGVLRVVCVGADNSYVRCKA